MNRDLQQIKRQYDIIGNCEALDRALEIALAVAPTELTMLILGENGVGKDIFSRIIHDHSRRSRKRFMAINCGSIPEGTINSELFGHVKGAFTDASNDREGYFSVCNGGTLFLDEVGELPLTTQALLLRVLEKGEYIPVGSDEVKKTDVRLIAATNVNMLKAVREGRFRQDLYYRLNVVSINVPPLRSRGSDINLLFKKFALDTATKYGMPEPISLDSEAAAALREYSWPGNIRQLRNLAESMSITAPEREVTLPVLRQYLPKEEDNSTMLSVNEEKGFESERTVLYTYLAQLGQEVQNLSRDLGDLRKQLGIPYEGERTSHQHAALPAKSQSAAPTNAAEVEYVDAEAEETMEEVKKELLRDTLRRFHGSRKKTAEHLNIAERTLYRYIKEYGLEDVK
ncbi:MAG: sigma-54-dependent Fis family transcriptional regulator [Bacteroidaceae bacterium]|nr:sigma-54-dependent Fis family transcriptional regulator [Bacteroidaceae bacterium]MBO4592664.1 sigma-54-dependent Fis family transcriptional regulator [Bacteroidaceae bacterium]